MRNFIVVSITLTLGCGAPLPEAQPDLSALCDSMNQIHLGFSSTKAGFPNTASDLDVDLIGLLPQGDVWQLASTVTGPTARDASVVFHGSPAPGGRYTLVGGWPSQAGQAVLVYSEVVQGQTNRFTSMSGTLRIIGQCGTQLTFVVEQAVLGTTAGSFVAGGNGAFTDWTQTGDRACSRDGAAVSCGATMCQLGAWCDQSGASPVCKCGDQAAQGGCTCNRADASHPGCGLLGGCA